MERANSFTGEFRHSLDERGRVAVPARFRPRLAAGATLARWLDGCLGLFPDDEWLALSEKIAALPVTSPQAREFSRFMFSGAVDADPDRQGRILVPGFLREYAGIGPGGEVVVVGSHNRIELWSPDTWQSYRSRIEKDPESLAEHLAGLGI
ncbi:MAG: division/cell wall cluster transcriptional repressor MraZ [Candidatus Limnocylindria bacterium]